MRNFTIICLMAFVLTSRGQAAGPATPPKLTVTVPALWAVGVNPSQKEISLTFDQQMSPGYTAWLGRSSLPPEVDINSTMSQDRRTFAMKVKLLQPGKVYVFALNEKAIPGVGFQNETGLTLPSTYLVFQTAGTPKPEDAPPLVVRSLPTNGDPQVDPAKTKAIVLTFDRPMQTAKQGLHVFENNIPVDLSKSRFGYSPDGRTFTLYYDFKPSTSYRVALNNTNDIGFASVSHVPLWPVQISFSTR